MIEDSEFIPWNENYRWHHQGALGAEQPPKNERAADVERCLALLAIAEFPVAIFDIYIYTIDICVLIFIAWHNITRYQQISPVSWANPNSIFGDIPTKLGSLCPDGYYPLLPGQSWTAHLRIAKTRVFHYWNTVLIPWWLELLLKFWSLDWYESCMGFIDAWEPAMNPKTHKTLCIEMTTWK